MSQNTPIVGAVPVLATPFDSDGAVDVDSLQREIDFCIASGAQAIAFGTGSESQMLTDAERQQVWSAAVSQVNGRMPVIATPMHPSREGIIALVQLAKDCGINCVMTNPENRKGSALIGLFRDLSERVGLPIMVQDAQGNAPVETLLQAVKEAPQVTCLKIECPGAPNKIGDLVAGLKELAHRSITVLGGSNGNALPEELERGSVGSLPHPAIIDAFRKVCDLHASGDTANAAKVYYQHIQPLNRLTTAGGGIGGGIWLHKVIFERAGILKSAYCRIDTRPQPNWVMEKVWAHLEQADLRISGHL